MRSRYILSPTLIGVICGILSAILYTVTNICLRYLGEVDSVWVSTVKAIPTFLLMLPLVVIQRRQGVHFQPSSPKARLKTEILWLGLTSIGVQIFGNVAFQVALSILGLTISVPIVLATMLIGGALSGRIMLGEHVSQRKIVSIMVLILATVILSYSAGDAGAAGQSGDVSIWRLAFGLLANVASGIAYALQGALMRRSMQRGVSAWMTLLIISSVGVAFLLSWSLWSIGVSGMLKTASTDLLVMAAAGVFNAMAFMAMAKSLQHVSVLFVQLLNASQAAISALAGFFLFSEKMTALVFAGIALTSAGLLIAGLNDEATHRDSATGKEAEADSDLDQQT